MFCGERRISKVTGQHPGHLFIKLRGVKGALPDVPDKFPKRILKSWPVAVKSSASLTVPFINRCCSSSRTQNED
jgi:hypothetical protein